MNSIDLYFDYYKNNYEMAGLDVPNWVLKQEAPDTNLEIKEIAEDSIDVRLNGPIDDVYGINVSEVISKLDEHKGKNLNLTLTSPGGFLFDGLSLYGALSDWQNDGGRLQVRAQGLVGSAAAAAYLAADIENRTMSDASMYFLHGTQAMTLMAGNKESIKKHSEELYEMMDSTDRNLVNILKDRTDIPHNNIDEWIDNQKFLNKEESIEFGIAVADSTSQEINNVENKFDQKIEIDEGLKQYLDLMRLKK